MFICLQNNICFDGRRRAIKYAIMHLLKFSIAGYMTSTSLKLLNS